MKKKHTIPLIFIILIPLARTITWLLIDNFDNLYWFDAILLILLERYLNQFIDILPQTKRFRTWWRINIRSWWTSPLNISASRNYRWSNLITYEDFKRNIEEFNQTLLVDTFEQIITTSRLFSELKYNYLSKANRRFSISFSPIMDVLDNETFVKGVHVTIKTTDKFTNLENGIGHINEKLKDLVLFFKDTDLIISTGVPSITISPVTQLIDHLPFVDQLSENSHLKLELKDNLNIKMDNEKIEIVALDEQDNLYASIDERFSKRLKEIIVWFYVQSSA